MLKKGHKINCMSNWMNFLKDKVNEDIVYATIDAEEFHFEIKEAKRNKFRIISQAVFFKNKNQIRKFREIKTCYALCTGKLLFCL